MDFTAHSFIYRHVYDDIFKKLHYHLLDWESMGNFEYLFYFKYTKMGLKANKNAFDIVTNSTHGFILSIKKFKGTRQQFKLRKMSL